MSTSVIFRRFSTLFMPAALLMLTSCSASESYRQCEGVVWGTVFHITYKSDKILDDSIHKEMQKVEMSLSPFNDSSLISRINRGETAATDSMFRTVFFTSAKINGISAGKFDPTVAPLVNLWGFGYKKNDNTPSQADIDSILPTVGIRLCSIDGNGHLTKKHPATEFNFSAIAKGLGCDMIAGMLKRNGCNDYMIEIGGDIAIAGKNHRGNPWRIMIDSPIDNDTAVIHKPMTVITPGDGGIATSGNYRNFKDTGNGRVWHTIDPITGFPAKTATLSATVIAPTAMEADALATACLTMSADSSLSMIDSYPHSAVLLITADSISGQWKTLTSSRFPQSE